MMDNFDKKYKAIDFFCGGGGMTCGLSQAGIHVIAGVDIDSDAQDTYLENNKDSDFVLTDIKELPLNYFEEKYGLQRNDDNLIFAGCSPCQFYSIMHTSREKSKKSKDLLLDFYKFVEYYKPGYVLVENVPGIIHNKETILPQFLEMVENLGYTYRHEIINMKNYGIPQSRRRFSLIATRLNKGIALPEKVEEKKVLRDVLGEKNGFYPIPAGTKDPTPFWHSTAALAEINIKRLNKTRHDGGTRLAWKDDEELQLNCYKGKDKFFTDVFGRLYWDKPSSTITTKFLKISNGRFGHPVENRGLSVREGATLQTFPKEYNFITKSILVAAKLIGNAVPPEYARLLGEEIKRG